MYTIFNDIRTFKSTMTISDSKVNAIEEATIAQHDCDAWTK